MRVSRRLMVCAGVLLAGATTGGAQVAPGTTLLVSRPPGFGPLPTYAGVGDNWAQGGRRADATGARVVFRSAAGGLDASVDPDTVVHCALRDTVAETTVILDRRAGASREGADRDCQSPSISGDGSVVAFESDANLLVPGDLDGLSDVIIWDEGAVTALGVPTAWAGSPSFHPDVTVTGSGGSRTVHVAFLTTVALVPEDVNGVADAYVRRFGASPGTVLVSRAAGTGTPAAGATGVSISGDGTRAAFATDASLAAADTGTDPDVYVRDLGAGSVTYVSRPTGSSGEQLNQWDTRSPRISRDGGTVAFLTNGSNMGGTGIFLIKGVVPVDRVYVRRLGPAQTVPMAVRDGSATELAPTSTRDFSISDDGTRVAFSTAGGTGWADGTQTYIRDVGGTVTTAVSRADGPSGALFPAAGGTAGLSGDGTEVLFDAADESLGVAGDMAFRQVFARDVAAGATRRISRPDGPATDPFRIFIGGPSSLTYGAAGRVVSAGGGSVVFSSTSDRLPAGTVAHQQVYVRDTGSGATVLLSRAAGGVPGDADSGEAVIDDEGGVAAFTTSAVNLGAPSGGSAIAVWRRATGDLRVFTVPGGTTSAPSITADGRYVVFAGAGDGTSAVRGQVWLADTATGDVRPLLDPGLVPEGQVVRAETPVVSADGTRVAFIADAALDVSDTNVQPDVYVLDIPSGRLLRGSLPGDMPPTEGVGARAPSLDGDGSVVAFMVDNAAGADPVFVRDLGSGAVLRPAAGGATLPDAQLPLLSEDGTRVAAIVNRPPPGFPDLGGAFRVVVYDLASGAVAPASRADGAGGIPVSAMTHGGDGTLGLVAFSTGQDLGDPDQAGVGSATVFLRGVDWPAAGPVRRTLARVRVTGRVSAGARPVVRFTLGVAGPVRVTVRRAVSGRVSRGRCRAGARAGRPCLAWTTVQTRRVAGREGMNTVRLAPRRITGRYRVHIAVTGGPARVIPFRVVRIPAR